MDDQVIKLPIRQSDVAIIGAGLSGINIACQLQRKLGVTDYVIYDRAADYGGTWFANRCETRHINSRLGTLLIIDLLHIQQTPAAESTSQLSCTRSRGPPTPSSAPRFHPSPRSSPTSGGSPQNTTSRNT